ncbi:hypothetical protein FHX44_112460 [Pseudonocardia hierapolitana]|uniref:Uncharacterized protein n=1 Tax=Pseudonocardia hierapolitana TaxID=1128676 RepID=A0A561SNX9_9PSEU|nr:hypothetical protein [Pseudonocardia hierapolitana]TWF76567.1 hypothetical protein FHX44_112460 [Pseudonocardia hierapolitana]
MSTFRAELVPTWAKVAAWAVPASVLPSAVWRVADWLSGLLRGGHPCAAPGDPLWEKIYVPSLSVVSLGLALLTLGLVRPWGEVFAAWMPWIGGRRVPVALAVGAATTGALLLTAFIVRGLAGGEPRHPLPPGCVPPGWEVLQLYAPMILWPPLLLAVTWHHHRRRAQQESSGERGHLP